MQKKKINSLGLSFENKNYSSAIRVEKVYLLNTKSFTCDWQGHQLRRAQQLL